jgi:cell division protein FtsL
MMYRMYYWTTIAIMVAANVYLVYLGVELVQVNNKIERLGDGIDGSSQSINSKIDDIVSQLHEEFARTRAEIQAQTKTIK